MDHQQAREIIARAEAEIVVDEDAATASISGTVTLEELLGITQLLEYSA